MKSFSCHTEIDSGRLSLLENYESEMTLNSQKAFAFIIILKIFFFVVYIFPYPVFLLRKLRANYGFEQTWNHGSESKFGLKC